jgi:hypothetical protein
MMTTIYFDNDFSVGCAKIDNIISDDVLTAKVDLVQTMSTQV